MHVEIEAKLKVDSLAEVERRLAACGAAFRRETVQTDFYFDTDDGALTRADRCLRLRREETGEHARVILAYKGAKESDDYKKRREIELEVNDAEAAELLLKELGYGKALAFDKRRRTWELLDCEVALDELPLLGTFVEIEGPASATIARVQEMLGLSGMPHIRESYAALVAQELGRRGRGRRAVYLRDTTGIRRRW
jgi:adenylate cyclase class 2